MFTIFPTCNNETVYNLIEQPGEVPSPGPPLYRSRFSCKVREDAYCAKTGCYRTMGIPRVCLCPPENYLKKQSLMPISIRPPGVPKVKMVDECQTTNDCNNGSGDSNMATCGSPETTSYPQKFQRVGGYRSLPPVQPHCSTFGIIPSGCKNFIRDNIRSAIRQVPKKPALRFVDDRVGTVKNWCTSGLPRLHVCNEDFGKVPSYIREIQQELYMKDQADKEAMKMKEREMQANCRPLDPTERKAILCGLKQNWREVFAEYQALPLMIDTPGKVQKKSEFEKALKELERDIQMVERHDYVFVADTPRAFYLA